MPFFAYPPQIQEDDLYHQRHREPVPWLAQDHQNQRKASLVRRSPPPNCFLPGAEESWRSLEVRYRLGEPPTRSSPSSLPSVCLLHSVDDNLPWNARTQLNLTLSSRGPLRLSVTIRSFSSSVQRRRRPISPLPAASLHKSGSLKASPNYCLLATAPIFIGRPSVRLTHHLPGPRLANRGEHVQTHKDVVRHNPLLERVASLRHIARHRTAL